MNIDEEDPRGVLSAMQAGYFFFPPNTYLSGTYEHTEKRHLLFWLPSITSP